MGPLVSISLQPKQSAAEFRREGWRI